jgi:hypothetical protein
MNVQINKTGFTLPLFLILFFSSLQSQTPSFQWVKQMEGTFQQYGGAIAVNGQGNVYTTGRFYGSVDFDPGAGVCNISAVSAYSDFFVSKLSPAGSFVWARGFGGKIDDEGNSIAVDALGNNYVTGSFLGTVDFDPGPATFKLYPEV